MRSSSKTRKITLLALLFAVAVVLSYLETLIPSGFLPAGIKPGLSNIVTMFCAVSTGPLSALALAALKSGFALLTRGATAGLLSLCGGLVSVAVMLLLLKISNNCSYAALSISGAITHNLSQLGVAALLLYSETLLWYAPVLVLSGIVMGLITAAILRAVMPALTRLFEGQKKE